MWKLLFSFKGRIRRKTYWLYIVSLVIPLVLIGLIVGGVLVGQDLIKAAEHRKFCKEVQYEGECKELGPLRLKIDAAMLQNPPDSKDAIVAEI